jgi:hypothetical protein
MNDIPKDGPFILLFLLLRNEEGKLGTARSKHSSYNLRIVSNYILPVFVWMCYLVYHIQDV